MTDLDELKDEILLKVDEILKDISGQSLVDSSRMVDFCLDMRQTLMRYNEQSVHDS